MQTKAWGIVWLLALLLGAFDSSAQGPINYADWRLKWAEEFDTPLDTADLAGRWRFYYPWGRALDNDLESSYYTPDALHSANGVLNITVQRLAEPRQYRGKSLRYHASMLFSQPIVDSLRTGRCNGDGFSYGLFEVRVRQPHSTDVAPGFWLWGGAPDEIDVFEGNFNTVANNIHLTPGTYWRPTLRGEPPSCQCFFYNADPKSNLNRQYHTYAVSWLPNELIYYFDGIPIRRETRLVPTGCAMHVILNLTAVAWAKVEADTLAVDYVRIYRPRQLPPLPPVLPPAAYTPQTELAWLPATVKPGRLDQGTHQTWAVAPEQDAPARLLLRLTDNYNAPCNQQLPLPMAGRWAPTWTQTAGTPELRVQLTAPDSLHWAISSALGAQPVAQGAVAGNSTWRPQWPGLAPGAYALHLRQGTATAVQPLLVLGRPAGSGPTAEWQRPAPEAPAADPPR